MTGPRLSIIPARAATDPALKPRDLQVLCVLGRHTDDLGWCMKSQVKMSQEMGCARSTVFEAIERLVKAGYLERHIQEQDNGRDAPHLYRVILDPVHPDPASIKADSGADTPADIPAPPAGISAPPAGPGPAPKNDPLRTEERGARAEEPEEEGDDPKHFERRVKRLADRLDWPGWANSSTAWAVSQFARLTDAERAEAERCGEAYMRHCGRKALSIGVYFAERKWRDVPDDVLNPPPSTVLEAKPFGPLWAAAALRELTTAPPQAAPPPSSAYLRELLSRDDAAGRAERLKRQAHHGWPKVNHWYRQAESRKGFSAPAEDGWLASLMEPVPVGSAAFEAWRGEYERRGWPWIPDPGAMPVVFFPKGGPEGLRDFQEAVSSEAANGEARDRAVRQEAGDADGRPEAAE